MNSAFLLDETRHTDPLSEQIFRIRRSSKRRRALRESKAGHARPLASQDSAAKRRLRIGKIMDSKIIYFGICAVGGSTGGWAVLSEKNSAPPALEKWVRRGR
jgi:hypothetical protein